MAGSEAPLLSRDAIRERPDLVTERVEVPEWGGAVMVRTLSGEERNAWEKAGLKKTKKPGGGFTYESREDQDERVRLAIAVCVTADGAQMFTAEDAPWLVKKSGAALDRVFDAGRRLNHMLTPDEQKADEEADEDFS